MRKDNILTYEKKSEIFGCILNQFPDMGIYKVTRVTEWLSTNGYSLQALGYPDFKSFAADFPEAFSMHPSEGGEAYVIIKKWNGAARCSSCEHPADNFFGSTNLFLNDDIIEMSQQSLYALTKVLGNGLSVQEMKQRIYARFTEAKENDTLNFFAERYTFPIDCCTDGFLVNGIITKNLSPRGKSLYFSFEKTAIFCDAAPRSTAVTSVRKEISISDKDEIYALLSASFPFDVPQHMAAISKLLTDNHIDRTRYGCYKMKELLAQMDFLELTDVVLGGVPQIMVTLHRRSDDIYEASEPAVQPAEAADTPENIIPTLPLEEFCNLPPKPVAIIQAHLSSMGQTASTEDIRTALTEDFEAARNNGGIRFYEGKMLFPCRYLKKNGDPVELTLKRSTYDGKPWYLNYIDTNCRTNTPRPVYPGKLLESFAFLGSWSSFLNELADKAVQEEWDFADSYAKDNHILIQYIKYTFYRLTKEDKICISADGSFSAFNTGLVDKHYDDIYACFVPNEPALETKWKFAGFCTAASGGLGKQLVNCFNPLPQPPHYIRKNDDLIFDLEKPLHPDYEHIIIDNIHRLPVKFLSDQLNDSPEAAELIRSIQHSDRHTRRQIYDQLKELITDNSRLFIRIQNRIKDAIELARKRVRWNYKTAIPSYFPKRNTMSLMLPLCLTETDTPDVALVVELTQSGCYQGQTILTLPQAYIDARLLCRLNSDWLTSIHTGTSYDSEEEPD